MAEQFSLHWDNFHKNMRSGMQSLLESEDLVDVTLAVEGRYLKAHKMVLSLCSPYFRELFQTNPCKHPIVFMKDVSYIALSDLLQFMYLGEVQVAQDNLTTFIKTAEALQIKGLTGDSNAQSEDTVDQILDEKPKGVETTKRTHDAIMADSIQASPRVKKPNTPAPKRPKIAQSPNQTNVPVPSTSNVEHVTVDDESSAHVQSSNDIVHMKIEPSESTTLQLKETDISDVRDSYVDDTFVEDDAVDTEEDYTLMESTEDDPKPGTSTEEVGDGQGVLPIFSNTRRGKRCMIYDNCIFYINQKKDNSIFWVCSDYYKIKCRSRIVSNLDGSIRKTVIEHIHPPHMDKILEKFDFSDE